MTTSNIGILYHALESLQLYRALQQPFSGPVPPDTAEHLEQIGCIEASIRAFLDQMQPYEAQAAGYIKLIEWEKGRYQLARIESYLKHHPDEQGQFAEMIQEATARMKGEG
jgi:hypothetical protein